MPILKRGYGAARNLRGKSGARFPLSIVFLNIVLDLLSFPDIEKLLYMVSINFREV